MSTRLIHRPARLHRTIQLEDPIKIASVPTVRTSSSQMGGMLRVLMPLVAGLGMVLMMFSTGNPIRMAIGSVMLIVVLITSVGMYIRSKTGARKQAEDQRERFLEHLEEEEKKVFAQAQKQRKWSEARNPAPLALLDVMNEPHRLWERRPSDEDFLIVRLGVGTGELACGINVRPTSDPMLVPEPIAQAHLDRMVKRCSTIDDLPIAVPLHGVVSIVGDSKATANILRALLVQVAALHAPDDVRFHFALPLCADTESMQWALWLPHVLHADHFDGPIASRNVSVDRDTSELLYQEISGRKEELQGSGRGQGVLVHRSHLLIVVDCMTSHGKEVLNTVLECGDLVASRITLLAVSTKQREEPSHVDVRISIDSERIDAPSFTVNLLDRGIVGPPPDGQDGYAQRLMYGGFQGCVDNVSINLAEAVARKLSPLRLVPDAEPDAPLESTIALDRLLGITDFHTYKVTDQWSPRSPEDFLSVPIGINGEGLPIRLDIKESALNGMGPHGLCVGATGSGKSEVLRTLVLAQAICHPPDLLSFVLVDYKGGATFAGCEALPHTAAIVDNLEDAAGLVDRLHDAIYGEIQRRQRVLQAGGNLANIWEYNKLRAQGTLSQPLPHLFVVIDEFGELLAAKPEFIDLFVQIGRIGRSIGVHLLLASQRLEEGRLRGLESYLSYRIGLRTFSAQESRAAIGCADAHELPAIPGSGLLKVDPDIFERFKAAYVSGAYHPTQQNAQRELPPMPMPLQLQNTTEAWLAERQEAYNLNLAQSTTGKDDKTTTIDVVVARLSANAEKTRQIWLPPLAETLGLEEILEEIKITSRYGLRAERDGYLRVRLGLQDQPMKQWQGPLTLDLAGPKGNIGIVGSPQTGKTTTLRTLVVSTALTHAPTEVNMYLIDMSGSSLQYLEQLPHVGAVTSHLQEEKLTRLVAEMRRLLEEREQIFSAYRLDGIEQMRRLHSEGQLPDIVAADVFVFVDGWASFRKDYEQLADSVQELALRGLGFGIHVVLSSGRWSDFRLQLQGVLGTKLELNLNDPFDSLIGRKTMESMKGAPAGRIVTPDKLFTQVCTPTVHQSTMISGDTPEAIVSAIAAEWKGVQAPAIRLLPDNVLYSDLRTDFAHVDTPMIGLNEIDLGPACLDFENEHRHLVLIGEGQSGKTSTLHVIISEIAATSSSEESMICVFDLRRTLLGAVPEEYLGEYAGTSEKANAMVQALCRQLAKRIPPATVTIEQLRTRSWWSGPEIYIVVDDFELFEGESNPLRPLIPYIAQAADLGLHVIIARRSAGVGRSAYEPVFRALKDAGAAGVLCSGDRQEGQIWPGITMQKLSPGRALWVDRRGRKTVIQLAYFNNE